MEGSAQLKRSSSLRASLDAPVHPEDIPTFQQPSQSAPSTPTQGRRRLSTTFLRTISLTDLRESLASMPDFGGETADTSILKRRLRRTLSLKSLETQQQELLKTPEKLFNTICKAVYECADEDFDTTDKNISKLIDRYAYQDNVEADLKAIKNRQKETVFLYFIKHYISQKCRRFEASRIKTETLIRVLLSKGFDIRSANIDGLNCLDYLVLKDDEFKPESGRSFTSQLVMKLIKEYNFTLNQADERSKKPLLLRAVEAGNYAKVQLLLDISTADPHVRKSEFGSSGIQQEASQAQIDVGKQYSADPNITDEAGETALLLAVANKNKPLIILLMDCGAEINAKPCKSANTPLQHAVKMKDLDMVTFLVEEQKATLEQVNIHGETALMHACHEKDLVSLEIADYLLECGADINFCREKDSETPLTILLLNLLEIQDDTLSTRCKQLIIKWTNTKTKHSNKTLRGYTPLQICLAKDHYDIAEHLVKIGASINEIGANGYTPLFRAAVQTKNIDQVKTLLKPELKASPNVICNGEVLLQRMLIEANTAAKKNESRKRERRMTIIEALLQAEANLSLCSRVHCTTVPTLLLKLSDDQLFMMVVTYGAQTDWNVISEDGKRTPLTWVLALAHEYKEDESYIKGFKNILNCGTDPNRTVGPENRSALMIAAAINNDPTFVHALCEFNHNKQEVEINQKDKHGNTALHLACREGTCDKSITPTLEVLLANRARTDIPNNEGHFPIFFALQNKNIAAIHLLMKQPFSLNVAIEVHACGIDKMLEDLKKQDPENKTTSEIRNALSEAKQKAKATIQEEQKKESESVAQMETALAEKTRQIAVELAAELAAKKASEEALRKAKDDLATAQKESEEVMIRMKDDLTAAQIEHTAEIARLTAQMDELASRVESQEGSVVRAAEVSDQGELKVSIGAGEKPDTIIFGEPLAEEPASDEDVQSLIQKRKDLQKDIELLKAERDNELALLDYSSASRSDAEKQHEQLEAELADRKEQLSITQEKLQHLRREESERAAQPITGAIHKSPVSTSESSTETVTPPSTLADVTFLLRKLSLFRPKEILEVASGVYGQSVVEALTKYGQPQEKILTKPSRPIPPREVPKETLETYDIIDAPEIAQEELEKEADHVSVAPDEEHPLQLPISQDDAETPSSAVETVEPNRESPLTEIAGMSPTMLSQSDLYGDDSNADKSDAEQSGAVRRGLVVTAEELQRALRVGEVLRRADDSSSDSSSSRSDNSNDRSSSGLSTIPETEEDSAIEGASAVDLSQMQESEVILEVPDDEGNILRYRLVADDENGETEV